MFKRFVQHVHVYNCRGTNLWGETHNHTVTVAFSLDGQKGMQLWQFVLRKRNAVIWDNAPRNPILMPRHTLQFAFSGFRFGTSLADVDGNNKCRPTSCRHACLAALTTACFCCCCCLSPQLCNNTKIKTFHLVNWHVLLHPSCLICVWNVVTCWFPRVNWPEIYHLKKTNKQQGASPRFPGIFWIIALSVRQSW